jgi:hypothetical protein
MLTLWLSSSVVLQRNSNVLTGVKGRIIFKLMLKGKYYGMGMFVVWSTGLAYDR